MKLKIEAGIQIHMSSVCSRVYRDSLSVNQSRNQPSPVAEIEHGILEVAK